MAQPQEGRKEGRKAVVNAVQEPSLILLLLTWVTGSSQDRTVICGGTQPQCVDPALPQYTSPLAPTPSPTPSAASPPDSECAPDELTVLTHSLQIDNLEDAKLHQGGAMMTPVYSNLGTFKNSTQILELL
ncbi:hypothetical protein AXG93_406s1530 [Marchantia polymorpha subsp. ruderalis]|uniref:Uncharacterized protein n=1 Tax=Marchantia polymorpha subsp. ruderalis TaxID=1480154 RepID=A0A176VDW5_MARPO|nr:hypothetical protein AXG93_406s1530 [Marchantia polymorpha subsp. ruderalis]